MQKISQILIVFILPVFCNAQGKYDYNWVTGYGTFDINFGGTKIDFSTGYPVLEHFALPFQFGFNMPCSISDMDGKLQFYSNGCKIANFNNEVMENGDDLSPGPYQSIECDNPIYGYDSYQNMMILPRPGYLNRYVYFHHTIESDISQGKILYSEVDMNFNNGKGKVIRKNQLLRGPVLRERAMTAVKHGNGQDWWIIIPQEKVNIYNLYLLTPDSIKGPFVHDWENAEAAQYEKFGLNIVMSPDGKKFARMTNSHVSVPKIYLYDFDRCSGTFSNVQTISMPDSIEYSPWIAISPNSRFLYLQSGQIKLYQYDLWASDISASAQLIGVYDGFVSPLGFSGAFNAMALAPNNKIYMCCTSGINYYHTIHAPDKPGLACDFRQHDLELPTVNNNLMPLYPNYRLGPIDSSSCDTLGWDNLCVAFFRWESIDTLSPLKIEFTDLSYFEPAVWFWDFGDGGAMSQEINPVHTYTAPGIYQVCLTVCNANTCDWECKDVEVKAVSTVSVHGEKGELILWPNPVSDRLRLQVAGNVGYLQVFNATGQMMSQNQLPESQEEVSIDVQAYPPGLYYVNLQTKDRVLSGKFIKN